jgi:GT2 family glycosyltransferase
MIYVIIPVYNRIHLTIKCLKSLELQLGGEELEIIVVDDGSTDQTSTILKKKFPKIKILNGNGSLYWCGAVSLGIEYCLKIGKKDDWILLVNNDVELSDNTILNLINMLKNHNRKAIAGAISLSAQDKKTIIKSGTVVKSWFWNITEHLYQSKEINQIKNYDPKKVNFLTGRCLLHPIEIFRDIGNYDSVIFRHYGADDEFSMRAKKFGYEVFLCPKSIVFLEENEKKSVNKNFINFFINSLFGFKSNQNIINKFNLTRKVVPFYAQPSYFAVAIIKSIYVSFKKFYNK